MQRIYLDYAAATPVDDRVMKAMEPYFSNVFYNPSALYEGARTAKYALNEARSKIAQLIGAKPSEIIFTAGGTESANLAVHGTMQCYPNTNLLISAIEHEAVAKPAASYKHVLLPVDSFGRVMTDQIEVLCTDSTVLVSIMLANNEIGTVQPIREAADIVYKIRQSRKKNQNKIPLYLHIDACQAPLYLDINVARLGVDMMTLNGGKIYGPKQSGILYIRAGIQPRPMIEGGGQEFGYRSGTENVAFAVGFAKALELADKNRQNRAKDMTKLREYFMQELENKLSAQIIGHRTHRLANNVHVVLPDTDNERVLFALDDMGVDAAVGSACSASSDTPSRVMLAIGKSDSEARSSLRFSMGETTTMEIVDKTVNLLLKATKA